MKRLLLTALAFGFAFDLSAQCSFQPVYKGQYRFSALDVALDGNDLWLATSYGVALYDRSVDPPVPVTSLALPGTTTRVRPTGGPITYAASGTSVYVLQKSRKSIVSLRSLDVGGSISDLLYQPPYLYVAATNGVTQVDLLQPDNPVVAKRLPTSTGKALGLAILGNSLYAADGDSSVEVYTIQIPSFPQNIGSFPSLPRSSSVRTIGSNLIVSDGQQTQIFTGTGTAMTRLSSIAAGASSLAPISGDRAYIAGNDRTLRAVDLRNPASLVMLFETSFAPTSGSVNRFGALVSAPGHLYGAAGDAGLLTFDTSLFGTPDQLRSYQTSPSRSIFSFGDTVFVSAVAGGIQRFAQDSSGNLFDAGSWDAARVSTIQDGVAGRLLTSSGNELRLWDVTPSTPVTLSTVTFRGGVVGAILLGNVAYAILGDQTLWRSDLSQPTGTSPTQVPLAGSLTGIARSGISVAVVSVNADGNSTLYAFPTGDLTSSPLTAQVEGAATSGVATNGSVAAVSTFKGLTVFDYAGGKATRVLPGSNLGPARDLFVLGNNLFVLGSSSLQIWDLGSSVLRQTLSLPEDGVAIHGTGGSVDIATEAGVTTVLYDSPSRSPRLLPAPTFNNYYKKVFVSGNQLYLFDGRSVERHLLSGSNAPAFIERLPLIGSVVDVAAVGTTIFVLDGLGKVSGFTLGGGNVGDYQMAEGDDAVPLDLHSAAGALYLSLSRGCSSGNCEKKTLVLDPRNGIALASTLTGSLLDITVVANRAYAIFDTPSEVRVLNTTDPFHPVTLAARVSEGSPVSVAYSATKATVYTIGSRIFAYTEASLAPAGQVLEAFVLDPSGRLSYLDQQLHVDGDCAAVTGRTFSPSQFTISAPATWVPLPSAPTAAAAKSSDLQNGLLYVLTDYSVEIWSRSPLRVRRHASRP